MVASGLAMAAFVGCAPRAAGKAKAPGAMVQAEGAGPVSDDGFAPALHQILRDGNPSPARTAMLTGVVARQLEHARERFLASAEKRGTDSVIGALYLVRAAEMRLGMVQGNDESLSKAFTSASIAGDEGRATALLMLRAGELPTGSKERKDVDEHLAALASWQKDTRGAGPLEQAGAEERVRVARALLEPTPEALAAARDAILAWIDRAIAFNDDRRPGAPRPRREEAVEAYRAFRSGAETLAALYLRSGDAPAALVEIERLVPRHIVPPQLYEAVEQAASGGNADAWRNLLGWLANPQRSAEPGRAGEDPRRDALRDDPELATDPDLLRAAIWGTALETYRHDPSVFDVAMAVSAMLIELGMPEGAPLVLFDAIGPKPDVAVLGTALHMVAESMAREEETEDAACARRIFKAAEPLIGLADRPSLKNAVKPSAARLRLEMAAVETRTGNLNAARTLLETAAVEEPSVDTWLTVAAIDRQAGNLPSALAQIEKALATGEAKNNPAAAAEAHLVGFEIQREGGANDKARPELSSALTYALQARKTASTASDKARAERLLARVLERYADPAGAQRATERAFAAAGTDPRQVTPTVLDAAARAFVQKDVKSARAALARASEAALGDDDLVYVALWLSLLEKDVKVRSDGAAARSLSTIHDDGKWSGRLASWGLGKIKDAELAASARTPGQKTEAAFYTAMARRASGDVAGAETELKLIAHSKTIDLIEVELARQLVRPPAQPGTDWPPGLPPGTAIP